MVHLNGVAWPGRTGSLPAICRATWPPANAVTITYIFIAVDMFVAGQEFMGAQSIRTTAHSEMCAPQYLHSLNASNTIILCHQDYLAIKGEVNLPGLEHHMGS